MRLVTYVTEMGTRLGVEVAGGVLDVAAARTALGGNAPVGVHGVIAGGEMALAELRDLVQRAGGRTDLLRAADKLTYAPCVPHPPKIICVGLNYRRHAMETNMAIPTTPVLFSKFQNSLAGAGEVVPYPTGSREIDYEAELTIVIGRRAENVSEQEALSYVFGYCNGNDLSARDLQFRSSQWLLGKTLDGFCPIGPALVTADEVENPDELQVQCRVNGELRQNSNSADMIFSCSQIISYISRYVPLEPGDIILTGTPEGVAMGYPAERKADAWLKNGDTVTVEIGNLGRLTTTLRR
jgi:2-keto-4-pentenoate hydratase/2-oxohepta-3-ene-1,7-dioic acid hydratase in catechol pathway